MHPYFCTYHEYRVSYSLAGLTGVVTGLVDALVEDWSIKAFIWSGILILYSIILSYELIIMETPPKPLLQSILFTLSLLGLVSSHYMDFYKHHDRKKNRKSYMVSSQHILSIRRIYNNNYSNAS
jgi:hypothetical protein